MSFDNLETILITFANKVLDAKNGVTNPTLGELIDEPLKAIQQAHNKAVNEARLDEVKRARSVDSQLSSADIVNHLEERKSELSSSNTGGQDE